jgi:hypothetical protein
VCECVCTYKGSDDNTGSKDAHGETDILEDHTHQKGDHLVVRSSCRRDE